MLKICNAMKSLFKTFSNSLHAKLNKNLSLMESKKLQKHLGSIKPSITTLENTFFAFSAPPRRGAENAKKNNVSLLRQRAKPEHRLNIDPSS